MIVTHCDSSRHKQEWLLCSHGTGQPYRAENFDRGGRFIGLPEQRMFIPVGGHYPYRVGCDVMAMCWKCKARAAGRDTCLELDARPSLIWAYFQ